MNLAGASEVSYSCFFYAGTHIHEIPWNSLSQVNATGSLQEVAWLFFEKKVSSARGVDMPLLFGLHFLPIVETLRPQ